MWDYFNDFLGENQNGFSARFSVQDPMFIMPAFFTYDLNANIPPQQCLFENIITNGEALKTKYQLIVSNCIDSDTPLKYTFYYYKN